jgi:hypothetical protein
MIRQTLQRVIPSKLTINRSLLTASATWYAPFLCLWNGREDAERSFPQLELNRATSDQLAV